MRKELPTSRSGLLSILGSCATCKGMLEASCSRYYTKHKHDDMCSRVTKREESNLLRHIRSTTHAGRLLNNNPLHGRFAAILSSLRYRRCVQYGRVLLTALFLERVGYGTRLRCMQSHAAAGTPRARLHFHMRHWYLQSPCLRNRERTLSCSWQPRPAFQRA